MGPDTTRRGKGQGSVFYSPRSIHKYGARAPYVKGVAGKVLGYFDSRHAAQRALDRWLAEQSQQT